MSNTVKEKMLPLGMVFLLVGVVWQLGNDYGAGKATVLANTNAIVGNSTAIMRN